MLKELSPRERKFVSEYMVDRKGPEAYRRAFGPTKNPASASLMAHKWLKRPHIKAAVLEKVKKQEERTEITADRILNQLAKIGFADLETSKTINAQAQVKALELLGKNKKMWTDRVEHIGAEQLADRLKEARERVKKSEAHANSDGDSSSKP